MDLKKDYSIGVVTYVNRYYTYFKPNILSLLENFPDKQIICVINGHPNKLKNIAYLKEITQWLSSLNIQYITFEEHQSLAKCWNWILLMSCAQNNLFLNDDILVKDKFRLDFEKNLNEENVFFTINRSFSHFLINKSVIRKIGWFDERFLGIGEEDGDYLFRMVLGNIKMSDFLCRDIINFIAPGDDPSFQNISPMRGKYASVNREFMDKKWSLDYSVSKENNQSVKFLWYDGSYKIKLNENMETPNFYDFLLLDNNQKFAPSFNNFSGSCMNFYKHTRNFFKKNRYIFNLYQHLKNLFRK